MLTVNGVGPTAIVYNGTSLTQVWACNHVTGECNLVWPNLPDSFQLRGYDDAYPIWTQYPRIYADLDRYYCSDCFRVTVVTDGTRDYQMRPVGCVPEVKIESEVCLGNVTCIAIYCEDEDSDWYECYAVCNVAVNTPYPYSTCNSAMADLFNYPDYYPSSGMGGNLIDAAGPYGLTNATYKMDVRLYSTNLECWKNCILVDGVWKPYNTEGTEILKWRLKATERYTGCIYYTDWTFCCGNILTFNRSW